MPRKSSRKSGGAFAYVSQFNETENLSPCYKPLDKAPIPKLGWHAGGSACCKELTVSQMGIRDTPLTKTLSPSEVAWNNRFTCPDQLKAVQSNQVGGSRKIKDKLRKELESGKKSVFSISAVKGGKQQIISVDHSQNLTKVNITDSNTNSSRYFESQSAGSVMKKLEKYSLRKMNKSRKL